MKEFEREIAEETGGSFIKINMIGMPRKISPAIFKFTVKTLYSAGRMAIFASKNRVDAVICTGGYTSFPAAFAAVILKKPLFLHEQNAVPGLVNRLFMKKAKLFFLSMPLKDMKELEKAGVRFAFSGNPVRKEAIAKEVKEEARKDLGLKPEKKTVLVFGGSQGAMSINQAVLRLLSFFLKKETEPDFQLIHLTGKKNFSEIRDAVFKMFGSRMPEYYCLLDELSDMGKAYSAADIVFSRSGASTIAELMANGKPAILVPYPFATDNHQYYNALEYCSSGAGILVQDDELSKKNGREIYELISKFINDAEVYYNAQKFQEFYENKNPQELIAEKIIEELSRK